MATDVIIDPANGQIFWNDGTGSPQSISIGGNALDTISVSGYSAAYSPGSTPAASAAGVLVNFKDLATGTLTPGTNAYELGSGSLRWKFFGTTTNISDNSSALGTNTFSLLTGLVQINGGIAISGNAGVGQTLFLYNPNDPRYFVGLRSSASLASTQIYTFPLTYPSTGSSILQSDTAGTLTWVGSIGTATSAANINVVLAATNASHQVLFTPTSGSASGVAVSTENSFVYNPSTDILSVSGLAVTSSTASTNTTTGALIVTGGVGIGGSVIIGGRVGIGTNLLNAALNIQVPSTTTSGIVIKGNGSQTADAITTFSSTGTTNFAVGADGRVRLTGMDGIWTSKVQQNIFDVTDGRINFNLTTWQYSSIYWVTAGSTIGQASNQLQISNNGTTSITGVGVLANGWSTSGGNRAFGIVSPSGTERTYFNGYGNLVINPNNPNPLHDAWNQMHLLSMDISGTANTYIGNIILGKVEGTERFSVGPFGNTRITVGSATTATGLLVKAVASQSGNIIETQASTGVTNFYVSPTGGASFSDNVEIKSAKEVRFNNSGNTFYTGFKAGSNASNTTYTLPIAFPGSGTSILQSDTSGTLTWVPMTAASASASTALNINIVSATTGTFFPLFTNTSTTANGISGVAVSVDSMFSFDAASNVLIVDGATMGGLGLTTTLASFDIGNTSAIAQTLNFSNSTTGQVQFNFGTASASASTATFFGSQNSNRMILNVNSSGNVYIQTNQVNARVRLFQNNTTGNVSIFGTSGGTLFLGEDSITNNADIAIKGSVLTGGGGNVRAAIFTLATATSNGTGVGGTILFQTSTSGSAGNNVNTLRTRLRIEGAATGTSSLESIIILGDATSGTAWSSFVKGVDATGTDVEAGEIQIQAGRSTGTGAARGISFYVSPSSTTSATINAASQIARFSSTGFTIYSSTNATSTTSGALIVAGGVGIISNAMIGGTATVFSTTSATGISSGAFNVVGGASINGNAFIGGTTTITNTTSSTGNSTGAFVVYGGTNIGGNAFIGGTTRITSTTASTSTGSGALVVDGGAGIAGSLYVGTNVVVGKLGYAATNVLGAFQSSVNGFNQFIVQNTNNGSSASADFVLNNDLSSDSAYYANLGMNSSGWATTTSPFNAANAIYLTATTGDLVLGTTTAHAIRIGTGSTIFDTININAAGTAVSITPATASGTTSTGALTIVGGVGIGGSVNIGKSLNLWNPAYTFSTNLASGAVTSTTNYILPTAFPSGTGTSYLSASITGVMAWVAAPSSGGGTPGGSTRQIQYNNASSFAGAAGFEFTTGGIANTVSIFSASGTGYTMGLWVSAIGGTTRVGIGLSNPQYELEILGEISATNKSFVINHPTKQGMKLRYGSLEGPENGVYARGILIGNNVIETPDHWIGLVHPDTFTVNLTPIGKFTQLYVEKIEDYKVYVGNSSATYIHCFYTVWAERKDIPKLVTEY